MRDLYIDIVIDIDNHDITMTFGFFIFGPSENGKGQMHTTQINNFPTCKCWKKFESRNSYCPVHLTLVTNNINVSGVHFIVLAIQRLSANL